MARSYSTCSETDAVLAYLDIAFFILSRGRAKTIADKSLAIMPDYFKVLVPESQRGDYMAAGVSEDRIVTTPDDIQGLGALRNWVLDHTACQMVVMADDDFDKLYCFDDEKTRNVISEDEVSQILLSNAVMAKDAGVSVFGFTNKDIRSYYPQDPFTIMGTVSAYIGINGRQFRFLDDKFKVDYDYSLQALLVDRIVWIDHRYGFTQARDNNGGGNAEFRTQVGYQQSVDKLEKRWGSALKISWYKSQLKIGMTFHRRQQLSVGG